MSIKLSILMQTVSDNKKNIVHTKTAKRTALSRIVNTYEYC